MAKKKSDKQTPLMQQYYQIKRQYPDAVLLFRVGDFYETFGEDAKRTSKALGIVLTKRGNGSEAETALAGFPYHALDTYLPKLVRAGMRVAICEQLEDPKKAKKIVKRGVTEVITPGIAYSDNILDQKKNNFLAAVRIGKRQTGVAFVDVSTGEFYAAQGNTEWIAKLLNNFQPREIVFSHSDKERFAELFGNAFYTYALDEWIFQADYARDLLLERFRTASLKGFGLDGMDEAVTAAGAVLHYLKQNLNTKLDHIRQIRRLHDDAHLWMDRFTMRNLELIDSPHGKEATLLHVLDKTFTPMGGRLIRQWLAFPLLDREALERRLDTVESLVRNDEIRLEISEHLRGIGDMERILSRIVTGKASPREIMQLLRTLEQAARVQKILTGSGIKVLEDLGASLELDPALRDLIRSTLTDDPPTAVGKGKTIREGVSDELDQWRNLRENSQSVLQDILIRESERTGIPSLRIGFNNVFGYYLEVRNTHKDKVPPDWIRKQTLTAAERYITEELKELEARILGAEEKILLLEQQLYERLLEDIKAYVTGIQNDARLIARLDVLLSFALTAYHNRYTRPEISDGHVLDIRQGRHPVIERHLPQDQTYVPNDLWLDRNKRQMMMITGPNMSGKSALLRQTALTVIMAQTGSFVPAEKAVIGLTDKLFTRVGASDNIAMGESTFMVEMNETASILNNLSERSLILLDEIGRGTSTYDGISIAWAIAEFLHEHHTRPKTLFATHYHELNEMEKSFERIENFHISVKEYDGQIIFIRKLEPGGSEHSFGIHVARLAGMPDYVIHRAEQMLKQLEAEHRSQKVKEKLTEDIPRGMQLTFFQLDDPLLEEIRDLILQLDINNLTPVEALNLLNKIKNKLIKK